MRRCPRCSGQQFQEPVYRAARPQRGDRFLCLSCGEAEEIYPELPPVNLRVRRGRPRKVRSQ